MMNSADPRQIPGGEDKNHAIGRWVSGAGQVVSSWTAKKYALPDKTVASQILMYRQLLHTSCRPGLVLSRKYEATPAQVSVQHMPWWETVSVVDALDPTQRKVLTMVDTGKMVISYDNLITRLWNTALERHGMVQEMIDTDSTPGDATSASSMPEVDLLDPQSEQSLSSPPSSSVTLSKDRTKLPPIPHEYWVSRLGFQQTDPVTDFRSGGILSLALMVWIVEHCPNTYRRFCDDEDPAAVLPFGITSINVTDMIAKLLMLSKRTDRMDALLSQKPFWKMFSDPYAILTVQELALELLADVVQELVEVRRATAALSEPAAARTYVTVFDFPHILTVTEQRVEYDLLGAGPISITDVRQIHAKLRAQYQTQLQQKLQRLSQQSNTSSSKAASVVECPNGGPNREDLNASPTIATDAPNIPSQSLLGSVVASTNGFFSKGNPIWNSLQKKKGSNTPRAMSTVATNDSTVAGKVPEADSNVVLGGPDPSTSIIDVMNDSHADAQNASWLEDSNAAAQNASWLDEAFSAEGFHVPPAAPSGPFQISDDDDAIFQ